jgi:predicted nucleic acid-binding OB-fold protein
MPQIIIAIILFAIVSAFLYALGYVKEQRKNQELMNNLIKKCQEKILREIKSGKMLTIDDIVKMIEGTTSSLFWSKSKLSITDSNVFADNLVANMISEGMIEEIRNDNMKKYIIN